MSVESGVGVACGCLPGCKPLMNRMFPRIFGNSSQSLSNPRPSFTVQAHKATNSDTSASSSTQESYHLQSLRSKGPGVSLPEKPKDLPAPPPPPSRQELRPPSRLAFRRTDRARPYGVLGDVSDTSSEMIILQRGSVDHRQWEKSAQKF
jgi:hypothetical protein